MDPVSTWFWPALLLGTAAILVFSWKISIRAKRYHGIARFFAFESILALFLLNVRVWFRDPFSPVHILSWIFLTASLLLAVHSIFLYLKLGASAGQIENSTRLVVRGAYGYIRHPMYASLALMGLGIFFKRITIPTSILAAVDLLAVYVTAKIEEREMVSRFGSEYSDYMRRTKMFFPFLFLILAICVPSGAGQTAPIIRYAVSPDPSGSSVTVEAEFRLSTSPACLKDFHQPRRKLGDFAEMMNRRIPKRREQT